MLVSNLTYEKHSLTVLTTLASFLLYVGLLQKLKWFRFFFGMRTLFSVDGRRLVRANIFSAFVMDFFLSTKKVSLWMKNELRLHKLRLIYLTPRIDFG